MGSLPFSHRPVALSVRRVFSDPPDIEEALRISQEETDPRRFGAVGDDLSAHIERLARRAAASAQVELAWIEIKGPRPGRRVRVFIERPDDAVGLADCERVNEKLSALLDLEDPIPGAYTLEVSTPGLDRPLRTVEDCRRFCGRRVRIRHRTEGRRDTLVGTLEAVERDAVLCLNGPSGERRIAWNAVLGARLDPDPEALFGKRPGGRRRRPN